MDTIDGVGIMSGTSLDGLDIACCRFWQENDSWKFKILEARTITYPANLQHDLQRATQLSGEELSTLDLTLGNFIGNHAKDFIEGLEIPVSFIASHGHTVFHQPEQKLTLQIGSGPAIYACTRCPTIYNFRVLDMQLGGQGAPLVPIGDQLLFSEYDVCLNLGGIANLSTKHKYKRIAFDIAGANMVLNFLSERLGKTYDKDGLLASRGHSIPELSEALNSLEYYSKPFPKSLGYEWVNQNVFPLLTETHTPSDLLHTYTHHLAQQVVKSISAAAEGSAKILATGGGAMNKYLVQILQQKSPAGFKWVVPDQTIIEYKEALIFAFMGMLRLRGNTNIMKSVTGASCDHAGGILIDNSLKE